MKTEREIKLEEALRHIRDWNFIPIDPLEIEKGELQKFRRHLTLNDAREIAKKALEEK